MTRSRITIAAALLTAALVVTGCGGSGSDTDSAESGAAPAAPPAADSAGGSGESKTAPDSQGKTGGGAQQPTLQREIIRTGFLTLEAGDILQTRQRVVTIATGQRGQVASEETGTDSDDGTVDRANLVVRVPTAAYDATMRALQQLGPVKEVRQESADVTEQVVDVNSRVATQRAGLARMRALLARANTIGEVISVETELTRREADLEALLAKQKSLASQTELATLTVTLVRPGEAPAQQDPDRGFLTGLSDGWNAFTATLAIVLLAIGAMLPFLLAIVLVTVPVLALVRRFRRTPEPAPVQPD
jgi:uncharacterized protein DUF4349